MSKLRVPYQCLETSGNLLVAARGSNIDLFSLQDQSLLSTWKCPLTQESSTREKSQPVTESQPTKNSEPPTVPALDASTPSPPAKRRKLSGGEDAQKPSEEEAKGKKKPNYRSKSAVSGLDAPAIISLTVSRGGTHVIAASAEDKSIRVFESAVQQDGKHYLNSLSQRAMPKRPCALAVTADDSTIVTADKFGDVYSLPLLFSELESRTTPSDVGTPAQENNPKPKVFVPAANNLTVHSKRNLKALANQQRETNRAPEKSEPTFEHKLLLGHVSMLTDIALAAHEGRNYIISADRDEHIRVSRGIPQAHIIEDFCLGHTEFISRLCVPEGRSNVLISGGGDDELFVWDWLSGVLVSKANLQSHVSNVMSQLEPGVDAGLSRDEVKVAVSNILHARISGTNGSEDIVIATSEGVPALFTFLLTPENSLEYIQTVKLPGNALAVAVHTTADASTPESTIIASVDSINNPGSTTERRATTEGIVDPLHLYRFQGLELIEASAFDLPDGDEDESEPVKPMNLLYGLENLRKRDGDVKEFE